MIPIKVFRENPELIKKSQEKRGVAVSLVDEVLKADREWRNSLKLLEKLKHDKNILSDNIKEIKNKKSSQFSSLIKKIKQISSKINGLQKKSDYFLDKRNEIIKKTPNIISKDTPFGKTEKDNKVLRKWGGIFKSKFELKTHSEIAEKLEIADFDTARIVSGSGFVFLKNELALLDFALQKFAIDVMLKEDFELIEPPFMVRKKIIEGSTDLEFFKNMIYKTEGEDLYLIPSAEQSIVALHINKTLKESELPKKYVAFSPCFRKEIGSHGIDTKGLFRMHQFNKIEQVVFCKPPESKKFFDEMMKISEKIVKKLKLPYRVIVICSGDLGSKQAKQQDIELYFPREKKYQEVTSCSNCTYYQATRLNTRYWINDKEGGEKDFVHILNNTALATSRVMRAILEVYQQKDGSVKIPSVLVPYMNGIRKIKGVKKGKNKQHSG